MSARVSWQCIFMLSAVAFAPSAVSAETKMTYPPTRTDSVTDTLHGVEVPDPYRWLENAESPEVREWVDKQNAFTRSVLDQLPGRQAIRARLDQVLDIGTIGTPIPAKGH